MAANDEPKLIRFDNVIFNPDTTIIARFSPNDTEPLSYMIYQEGKTRSIQGEAAKALEWWISQNSIDVIAEYQAHLKKEKSNK